MSHDGEYAVLTNVYLAATTTVNRCRHPLHSTAGEGHDKPDLPRGAMRVRLGRDPGGPLRHPQRPEMRPGHSPVRLSKLPDT